VLVTVVVIAVCCVAATAVIVSLLPSTLRMSGGRRYRVASALLLIGVVVTDMARIMPGTDVPLVVLTASLLSAVGLGSMFVIVKQDGRGVMLDSWLVVSCVVLVGHDSLMLTKPVPGGLPATVDVVAFTIVMWETALGLRLLRVGNRDDALTRRLFVAFWTLRSVGWFVLAAQPRLGSWDAVEVGRGLLVTASVCFASGVFVGRHRRVEAVPPQGRSRSPRWVYLLCVLAAVCTWAALPTHPLINLPSVFVLVVSCGIVIALRQTFTVEEVERLHRQTARQEHYYRSLVQDSSDVIMICSLDGRLEYVSPSADHVLGRRRDDAPRGETLAAVLGVASDVMEERLAELAANQTVIVEGRLGDQVLEAALTRRDEQVLVSVRDVTERDRLRSRLQFLAYHDGLTGLPNRTSVLQRLTELLEGDSGAVTVLFVDLDRFKQVNDASGHAVGDEVLRQVGARFEGVVEAAGSEMLLGRIGGDEFVVVVPAAPAIAQDLASQLKEAVASPFQVDDHAYQLGASVGIAVATDGVTADDLLRNADVAMYHAKHEHRAATLYSATLGTEAVERAESDVAVAAALRAGSTLVFLQPQAELETGRVVGTEALLRWRRADGVVRGPQEMLEYATRTGQMGAVTLRMLHAALGHLARWPDARMAVNVPPHVLSNGDLPRQIAALLEHYRVGPQRLEIEVTEDQQLGSKQLALQSLAELRQLGLSVMLDDFGSGFSSFTYLLEYPIDGIKLDRSLIELLPGSSPARSIVSGVVRACSEMNLSVVAEGIETPEQHRCAADLGVTLGQGFYFARPENADLIGDPTRLSSWRSANPLFAHRVHDLAALQRHDTATPA